MPRPKRQVDYSTYETLPTITWKELLKELSQGQLLSYFSPNRQMLMPGGYQHKKVVDSKDDQPGTIQLIVFDSEFVTYWLHYRFLEPIGWFVGGKIDKLGFETFLNQQYQYSENIPRQAYLEGIREKAKELAASFPHNTEEEWYQQLLGASTHVEPKENGNAKSSKSKATV